jgi:hypothetical protein
VDDDVDALGFAIKAHQKKRVAIHDL